MKTMLYVFGIVAFYVFAVMGTIQLQKVPGPGERIGLGIPAQVVAGR